MINEILTSAKVQISERIASPLIGSFLISWCLWNYKFLVILFSKTSLSQTFTFIDTIAFPTTWSLALKGLLFPALAAAAYIFVYPYPAKFVYEFTRRRQKEINEVRQRIEEETLLTIEESRKIRAEALQVEKDHQEKVDRLNAEISRLKLERITVQVEPSPEPAITGVQSAQTLTSTQLALLKLLEQVGGRQKKSNLIQLSQESKVKTEFDLEEMEKLQLIKKNFDQSIREWVYEFLQEGRRNLLESVGNEA